MESTSSKLEELAWVLASPLAMPISLWYCLRRKQSKNYHLKPLFWKRFIDDVFCIWPHGKDELDKFVDYLNTIHESIEFTCESSTDNIDFLDTTVKLDHETNIICTTLYTKPTDTHSYLHYSSSHNKSCT